MRRSHSGRPKTLDESQVKVAIALADAGELPIKAICEQVGCSRSTYYRQVAPRLKAPAATEPLQLDQRIYVAPGAAPITPQKPGPKLSYVCKKQASKGGIVHAVRGEVGPRNWRAAALCGAKPSALKYWELAELAEPSCAQCRRKMG
ncbi:MAG: helix-turn-helix domain-containing protein [Phormidesmis sp.]